MFTFPEICESCLYLSLPGNNALFVNASVLLVDRKGKQVGIFPWQSKRAKHNE